MQPAIGRLRARGSTNSGVGHWKAARVTAIALVFLVLWFCFNAIAMAGASHAEWVLWFRSPVNASLVILLVLNAFYHAKLGVQEILEDYIHAEGIKVAALLATTFIAALLATICVVSVLILVTGG